MTTLLHEPVSLADARAAAERIRPWVVRTPLVRLEAPEVPAEIWLKLENLQPIGSFKIRGSGNAVALADPRDVAGGLWTASAGNMAQGVAWHARRLGVPATSVVPDTAPASKLDAIARLGGRTIPVPVEEWFEVFRSRTYPGMDGLFVHPFGDPAVMAGNATIGLEILDDVPNVDTVVVPFGGGGLSCGIASVLKAVRPEIRVLAAEISTGAPLAASLAAGEPTRVEFRPSFADGIGGPIVLAEMFDLARRLLDGSLVSSLDEVAAAVRLLATRARVVAEGAGGASVAAAMSGRAGGGRVVCVISGGNIDAAKLARILDGETP